jgi:hypothetical protein
MQRKLADMMAPFIPGSKNSPRAKRNSSGTMPNEGSSSKAALKTAVSDIAADINAIPAVHDASMLSPAISAQDMLSSAFDAIRQGCVSVMGNCPPSVKACRYALSL